MEISFIKLNKSDYGDMLFDEVSLFKSTLLLYFRDLKYPYDTYVMYLCIYAEAVTSRYSIKKVLLKISEDFSENTCIFFLNKVTGKTFKNIFIGYLCLWRKFFPREA